MLAQLDARVREAEVAQAKANLALARQSLKEAEANLGAVLPTVGGAGADIARAGHPRRSRAELHPHEGASEGKRGDGGVLGYLAVVGVVVLDAVTEAVVGRRRERQALRRAEPRERRRG